MPLGEMLYLALVIVAFLAFLLSLAAVSWLDDKYRASREGRD
jgi:hypothetical protein